MPHVDLPDIPAEIYRRLEQRARENGKSVGEQAAEYLRQAIAAEAARAVVLDEIRKERDVLTKQGVFLTDEHLQAAKRLGAGMIVVDTNVVAYLIVPGSRTEAAEVLRSVDPDWVAPELNCHEWLNVLTLYVKQKTIERDQAIRMYRRGLAMIRVEHESPDPLRVINLHLASGCSSYDCQFVDLAKELGVRLVTIDLEILNAFPSIAVSMDHFKDTV